MQKNRTYIIAISISIIIHLVLFLLKPIVGILGLADILKAEETGDEQPLVFELVDPYEPPQELVETPDDARVDAPPNDAQFLSDKNAQAQDMLDDAALPNGLSFSDGVSDYRTFAGGGPIGDPNVIQNQQQQQQQSEEERQGEREDADDETVQDGERDPYKFGNVAILNEELSTPQKKFSRDVLRGTTNPASPFPSQFSDDANWNNQESSPETLGGISLSTYEWDYAPYLLYMKRRIREHLYPPTAFIQMGAISGEVTLRFILRRDGTVRDLSFISNKGHNSFIDPSLNSVKASDPFKPLPDHFPDPHLELTWTFVYSVYR